MDNEEQMIYIHVGWGKTYETKDLTLGSHGVLFLNEDANYIFLPYKQIKSIESDISFDQWTNKI